MTSTITTTSLVKQYPNGVRGVDGVDLDIAEGEFFALLGPSGCGKTTLLRSIAGLETITEGTLLIGGVDMTNREPGERGVAMVFQDYALFPHMDVADNIAYPLRIRKVAKAARRAAATETAGRLSLEGLIERRPAQLSGGQQQRVALARAIATRPTVLLLDEPLSNLDARLRLEARSFLKELQRELGVTSVYVTHDQSEALALADRMAVMKDGRIQQVGTPREVFHAPSNTFVAAFIGTHPMNLISGVHRGGRVHALGAQLHVPSTVGADLSEGRKVVVGARPEYVTWSPVPQPDSIEAEVTVIENLGAGALVIARLGDDRLQCVADEDSVPEVGQRCWFTIPVHKTLVFDEETGLRIGPGDV